MRVQWLLMTAFGLGRLKPAPGTWGSLPPPLLALALIALHCNALTINIALAAIALLFSIACISLGGWSEKHFECEDPPQVVSDEVAGQSLALLLMPWQMGGAENAWLWNLALAATAFLTFRFFDILKPPPIGRLQRLPKGWGILADDLAAGLAALLVTQALARLVYPI